MPADVPAIMFTPPPTPVDVAAPDKSATLPLCPAADRPVLKSTSPDFVNPDLVFISKEPLVP